MNVIRSGWVLKVKHDENNLPVRWKARVVCRGYEQKYGIDYYETFAPVTRAASIKMLLSVAAQYGMGTDQSDFQTAFLNAFLKECIYLEQPEGFVIGSNRTHVWTLKKALYGLRQSGRVFNIFLDKVLKSMSFKPAYKDTCLYKRSVRGPGGVVTTLLVGVFVDDLVTAGSTSEAVEAFKAELIGRNIRQR
jgi:hypothetical protein